MSVPPDERHSLAVHDFVRVDLPFPAVVGAFAHFVDADLVRRLVLDAWLHEAAAVADAGVFGVARDAPDEPVVPPRCSLGALRPRGDAAVLSISWSAEGAAGVPPLHADIEVVGFGTGRCHLHVMGVSQLSPGVRPSTQQASIEQRIAVAVVRRVLHSIADRIQAEIAVATITG